MNKYCKNQFWRQKNYKSYIYCKYINKQVTLSKCKSCPMRMLPSYTTVKHKSNKLKKIEENRFSIIQKDMSICFFCGSGAESIHELIGRYE